MAPAIYLLRHGRTAMDALKRSDGWVDLPLSDKGRMGLIEPQQYLKLEPVAKIYSPPLRRTEETAHIIASGMMHKPDVLTTPKAMTWNLGVLAGAHKEQNRPKVKRLLANPDEVPLGGESYNEFKKRYMGWFQTRAEQSRRAGKPILLICSGSNLRLVSEILLDDRDKLNLDEGGLAVLHYAKGSWHAEVLFGDKAEEDEIS